MGLTEASTERARKKMPTSQSFPERDPYTYPKSFCQWVMLLIQQACRSWLYFFLEARESGRHSHAFSLKLTLCHQHLPGRELIHMSCATALAELLPERQIPMSPGLDSQQDLHLQVPQDFSKGAIINGCRNIAPQLYVQVYHRRSMQKAHLQISLWKKLNYVSFQLLPEGPLPNQAASNYKI